jgi:hypothetical protein
VIGVKEVAKDGCDLGESWVHPEVLSAEVAVKNAVHLGAVGVELRVVAHNVSAAVQSQLVSLQPLLAKVKMKFLEQLGAELPVVGVDEAAVAREAVRQPVDDSGDVGGGQVHAHVARSGQNLLGHDVEVVSWGALLVDDRHGGGVVGAVQHALAPPVVAVLSQPDECGGQLPKVGGLVGWLLARWEEMDVTLVTVPDASSSFVSVTCVNRNA